MRDFTKGTVRTAEARPKPITNLSCCRSIGVVHTDEGDIRTHGLDGSVEDVVKAELRVRPDNDLFEDPDADLVA